MRRIDAHRLAANLLALVNELFDDDPCRSGPLARGVDQRGRLISHIAIQVWPVWRDLHRISRLDERRPVRFVGARRIIDPRRQ
jgi:hypothetical protein